MLFKIGTKVVCVDVTQKSFYGHEPKPYIKTIKLWGTYTIDNIIPYSKNIVIKNDIGRNQAYSKKRFRPLSEFRSPKIKKIIKNIKSE